MERQYHGQNRQRQTKKQQKQTLKTKDEQHESH